MHAIFRERKSALSLRMFVQCAGLQQLAALAEIVGDPCMTISGSHWVSASGKPVQGLRNVGAQ